MQDVMSWMTLIECSEWIMTWSLPRHHTQHKRASFLHHRQANVPPTDSQLWQNHWSLEWGAVRVSKLSSYSIKTTAANDLDLLSKGHNILEVPCWWHSSSIHVGTSELTTDALIVWTITRLQRHSYNDLLTYWTDIITMDCSMIYLFIGQIQLQWTAQ